MPQRYTLRLDDTYALWLDQSVYHAVDLGVRHQGVVWGYGAVFGVRTIDALLLDDTYALWLDQSVYHVVDLDVRHQGVVWVYKDN